MGDSEVTKARRAKASQEATDTAWALFCEICRDAGIEPPSKPKSNVQVRGAINGLTTRHRRRFRPTTIHQAAICGTDRDGTPFEPKRQARPTETLAGTRQRMDEYRRRLEAGEELWSEEDWC